MTLTPTPIPAWAPLERPPPEESGGTNDPEIDVDCAVESEEVDVDCAVGPNIPCREVASTIVDLIICKDESSSRRFS